jgi:hypothetical protein
MGSVEKPDDATAVLSKFKSKRSSKPGATVTKLNDYRDRPLKVVTIPSTTPVRRKLANITKSWAPIPHHQGLELAKRIGVPALAVLLALQHAIHAAKSNRVKLTNDLLRRYGITRQAKNRGLRQLVAAEVISVEWNGQRAAPLVTHHWYTEDGNFKLYAIAPR